MRRILKKRVGKTLFALANVGLGAYLVHLGWQRGGIYLVTVLFAGAVMLCFGVALLFIPVREKKPLEYQDTFYKEE